MKTIQVILILLGGAITYNAYQTYVSQQPTPIPGPDNVTPDEGIETTIQILTKPDEGIPPQPANAGVALAADKLESILRGQPSDALLLARIAKQWADLFSRDTVPWKTTGEFREAYLKATTLCIAGTPIAGKYHGAVDSTVNETIQAAFSAYNLTDGSGIKPVAWTADCRAAARDAFNAISWAAYKSFGTSTIDAQP